MSYRSIFFSALIVVQVVFSIYCAINKNEDTANKEVVNSDQIIIEKDNKRRIEVIRPAYANKKRPEKEEVDRVAKERIEYINWISNVEKLETKRLASDEMEIRLGSAGGLASPQLWIISKNKSNYSAYYITRVRENDVENTRKFTLKPPLSGWDRLWKFLEENDVKLPIKKSLSNNYEGLATDAFTDTLEIKEGDEYDFRGFTEGIIESKGNGLVKKVFKRLNYEFGIDLAKID